MDVLHFLFLLYFFSFAFGALYSICSYWFSMEHYIRIYLWPFSTVDHLTAEWKQKQKQNSTRSCETSFHSVALHIVCQEPHATSNKCNCKLGNFNELNTHTHTHTHTEKPANEPGVVFWRKVVMRVLLFVIKWQKGLNRVLNIPCVRALARVCFTSNIRPVSHLGSSDGIDEQLTMALLFRKYTNEYVFGMCDDWWINTWYFCSVFCEQNFRSWRDWNWSKKNPKWI